MSTLTAPEHERIQIKLNMAEISLQQDTQDAILQFEDIAKEILDNETDLDIKILCLAKVLKTSQNRFFSTSNVVSEVEEAFNTGIGNICKTTAEQLDSIIETIRTVVLFDPEAAAVIAGELNTEDRRTAALHAIILETLESHGNSAQYTDLVNDLLYSLASPYQDQVLESVLHSLRHTEATLSREMLEVLHAHVEKMAASQIQAFLLRNLLYLLTIVRHPGPKNFATTQFRYGIQLRIYIPRLQIGFSLVEP